MPPLPQLPDARDTKVINGHHIAFIAAVLTLRGVLFHSTNTSPARIAPSATALNAKRPVSATIGLGSTRNGPTLIGATWAIENGALPLPLGVIVCTGGVIRCDGGLL